MSGYIRTEDAECGVGLWMSVNNEAGSALCADNMMDRPVTGTTDWRRHEIVLDVPETGTDITYGIVMDGKGQAWVDGLELGVVGNDVAATGDTIDQDWYPAGHNARIIKLPSSGMVLCHSAACS